jgi:hypothetical protein
LLQLELKLLTRLKPRYKSSSRLPRSKLAFDGTPQAGAPRPVSSNGVLFRRDGSLCHCPANGKSRRNSTLTFNIHYQAYAAGNPHPSVNDYLTLYQSLAQQYIEYQELTLGINYTQGLQLPDIVTVWNMLQSLGVPGVTIWSLEYSANNGYQIENALLNS